MILLKGKEVSLKIKEKLANRIEKLKSQKIIPSLAVIIVGDNSASKLYVASKVKTFKKMNCNSKTFELPSKTSSSELINLYLS